MELNFEFWRGKRVFVTGHTGFKGSWACLLLNILQCDVFGFSLEPETQPALFNIFDIKKLTKSKFGDIRDGKLISSSIKNFNPEIIIHFASKPLVRYSYSNPIDTYSTNVMGLMNIFESCKQLKNECIVLNITSDKCYFNDQKKTLFDENDKLGGNDIYSSSKACAEILSHAYSHSFFNDRKIFIATARAGNIIGGGDWSEDRIVTDIVNSIYNKKVNLNIRYPNAIRPWQHVLDPLLGYFIFIQYLSEIRTNKVKSLNFGPNPSNEISVVDFLEVYSRAINKKLNYDIIHTNHLHEDNKILLNINKAKEILGWNPKFSPNEAIKHTALWYDSYYKCENMKEYSINIINNFLSK